MRTRAREADAVHPELRAADAIGAVMQFWGFRRAMGRVWTVLYLSPEPLPASELQTRLGMSAGAASMTLGELAAWGAVKRTFRPGDRRDFWEAETQIGRLLVRVLRERELVLVREVASALGAAIAAPGSRFAKDRLSLLLTFARMGEAFLGSLLTGDRVDPGPIRTFTAAMKVEA